MPRGGHNKKPDALKFIQGTLRKGRTNPKSPDIERKVPRPSASLPKEAKKEYLELSKLLDSMRVLTEADRGELENLAIARAQIKYISKKLFKQSDINEFRKVQLAINDAIKISSSLSMKFGLSPADRERVSVVSITPEEDNPYAKLSTHK